MKKRSCKFILSKGSVQRIKEKLKALFEKKKNKSFSFWSHVSVKLGVKRLLETGGRI